MGGFAVDTNSSVNGPYFYIVDQGPQRTRFQKFDQNGNFIASYTGPDNDDDNPTGLGYSREYNELYSAALASDDAIRINSETMAFLNQNTSLGDVNMRDFAIDNNGDIFTIYGNTIIRWTRAQFIANGAPNNNWATALANSMSICIRSNSLYTIGLSHQIREHNKANGAVLETRGSFGYGDTNFWAPTSIAYDYENDLIWVSDTSNMRLVCYKENSSGQLQFVRKIESSPYIMRNPRDIAIDKNGNLYIVDAGFCKVKKFDQFGNFVMAIGGKGLGNGKFWDPWGVAVDDDGYIYVSDQGTANGDDAEDQIEKFDQNGNFVMAWNHPDGRGLCSFVRNGTNYILAIGQTDGATRDCAMRVYTTTGGIVQSFRNGYDDTDYGDIDVDFLGRFYCINSAGAAWLNTFPANASGSLTPTYANIGGTRVGLCIDPYGTLWVPDQNTDRVEARQTFAVGNPTTVLYNFSGFGTGDGQLNNPSFCAIKMRELPGPPAVWADLWIVDSGNNRLQKFTISWSNETVEPVTIANPGSPTVTAAYPDPALSTNVNYIDGQYYARQGKATFKIYFSQQMNTNIPPTVEFITADSLTFTIYKKQYGISGGACPMNNVWIGTAWIPTGHDGSASIRVFNAQNTIGSNINPNPTIINNAFIIDTTPPIINILNPIDGTITTATNILVDGIISDNSGADELRVDIFNWTTLTDGTLISSKSNVLTDNSGYFMWPSLRLRTPKDSTNFITVKARDKAGNWSSEFSQRRKVYCIVAIGYGYVEPSTNRYLGDLGLGPPFLLVWQANANMINGTVTFDVPAGWSPPSTNRNSAGYVRLYDYAGITFTTGKTLWTSNPSYPRRLKVNFNSALNGGYFKIAYGTNTLTMVSNSLTTAIGLNEFVAKATNTTTEFTNIWNPPRKVGEAFGKTLKVPVKGKPVRVYFTNKMPAFTYRGASDVPVMRLVFINSNLYHKDRIDTITFTVENSFNIAVNANTRLSSISLWTNGILYASSSAGASPYVTIDLSGSPLIIPPKGTNIILDVKMNISPTTTATDIKINLASKNDISAKNYTNIAGTVIDVLGNFPMRTTYATIRSNRNATRMFSFITNYIPIAVSAGEKNVLPMYLILNNTNTNVNEIEVTKVYIKVENSLNFGIVPYSALNWIKLQKKGGSPVYVQKTPENSGNTIVLEPINLFIPQRTFLTCEVRVDINSNCSATNFKLNIVTNTNIKARDKIFWTVVTNFPKPPYNFPMRTDYAEIAKYFRIFHLTNAFVNEWSRVIFKVFNVSNRIVRRYNKTITLDTKGTANTIDWTNNYSFNGYFSNFGSLDDRAIYRFSVLDNGVVTLSIKDTTEESVNISASDGIISDNDI